MKDDMRKLRSLFEMATDAYRPSDDELARLDARVLARTGELGEQPVSHANVKRYGAAGLGVIVLMMLGAWHLSSMGSSSVTPAVPRTRGYETPAALEDGIATGSTMDSATEVAHAPDDWSHGGAAQVPTLAVGVLPSAQDSFSPRRHDAIGTSGKRPFGRGARPAASGASDKKSDPSLIQEPVAARSSLEEEVRLVRGARDRRHNGDVAGALVLLDEHARRYPGGVLANERDVERIVALCSLGETVQATTVARAFLLAHPNSPLSERVRATCANGAEGENR